MIIEIFLKAFMLLSRIYQFATPRAYKVSHMLHELFILISRTAITTYYAGEVQEVKGV